MNGKKLALSIILTFGIMLWLYPDLKTLYLEIETYLEWLPTGMSYTQYPLLRDAIIPVVGAFVVLAVLLVLIWKTGQKGGEKAAAEEGLKPPRVSGIIGAVFALADASLFVGFLIGYNPLYMFAGSLVCAALLGYSIVKLARHHGLWPGPAVAAVFLLSVIAPITQYVTSQVGTTVSLSVRCVAVLVSCIGLYDALSDVSEKAKTRLFSASGALFLLAGLAYLFSELSAFMNLSLLLGFDTAFTAWVFMGLFFTSWVILAAAILINLARQASVQTRLSDFISSEPDLSESVGT